MSDNLPNEVPDGLPSESAPKKRVVRKKTTGDEPKEKPTARKKKADAVAAEASGNEPAKVAPVRKTRAKKTDDAPPAETEDAAKPKKATRAKKTDETVEAENAPVKKARTPRAKKADANESAEPEAGESAKKPAPNKKEAQKAPERVAETEGPTIKVVRETVEIADRKSRDSQHESNGHFRNGNNNNGKNRHQQQRQGKFFNKNGQQNGRNNRKNFRDARNKNNFNNKGPQPPLEMGPPEEMEGLLEVTPKGYGFLRTRETDFAQLNAAIYVSNDMIRTNGLRHAQWIQGMACRHERGGQLTEIHKVNGLSPEEARKLPYFDELKAVNPNKRIAFETVSERYTTRTLDLVSPVGRGQRGLIVSPPRAGKTTFLQHMAEAVLENHAGSLHLMVLLIDERPEEVTEFKRSLPGAEIYASSNDGKVRDHCRLAELCIERAKRLVEAGQHVFLLMDSITRLARAYNNADKGSGRTMSGGIDARALEMPRRLFAAARNTRQAGSLTIIATALVETNSRMDDLIFQEFKGTGNMELVLNRRIAEQYVYPAVDILKSGTRREELILPENWLYKIHLIRRALAGHKPVEAMERLLFFLRKYPNNTQMLLDLKQRV